MNKKNKRNRPTLKSSSIAPIMLILISLVIIILLIPQVTGIDLFSGSTANSSEAQGLSPTIDQRLRDIGLKDSRYMGSSGINTHMDRLNRGEISLDTLTQYADQLEMITEVSRQFGQPIPVTIWDVQTREMRDHNLTQYAVVNSLADPDSHYVQLLARAYNRLYDFKQNKSSDTALDTALDILLYTIDYYDQINTLDFDQMDSETAHQVGMDIIATWQRIIGNTPRINPLTKKPIFPYNDLAHLTVTDMWRHHSGRGDSIGDIWGVSGFNMHFVGVAINNNQVEHLAISSTLQYVYNESLIAMNGFEVTDVLGGGQTSMQMIADQTLNNTIATEFVPRFTENYVAAVEHLRCILSSSPDNANQCD